MSLVKIGIEDLTLEMKGIYYFKGAVETCDGEPCPIVFIAESQDKASEMLKELNWDLSGGWFEKQLPQTQRGLDQLKSYMCDFSIFK